MKLHKLSFDLFVGLWNARQNLDTPPIHLAMARWLAQQSRGTAKRLLLMAFRGCGKSTMTGLFCAWSLCQNPELRILIISADEALAENMLRHIRHILETHPAAAPLIPAKKQLWSADRLLIERTTISRDPSLRAAGLHSTITGARADLIICDDVEVPNTCNTHMKRQNLRTALQELDFILTPDGIILYIGTPHAEESIYAPGNILKDYTRLELPLQEGVWPERFSKDYIHTLEKTVGARIFKSQMLLQPTRIVDVRLDPACIAIYEGTRSFTSASCYWDPAFGHDSGDQSIVAYIGMDADQHIYIDAILTLPKSNGTEDAATMQCRLVTDFLIQHTITHLVLETNGLGQFLPGLLRRHLKERQYACRITEYHASQNKTQRILHAFEARLAAQSLSIHRRTALSGLSEQMRDWQPDSNQNRDDILDAVAGAILHLTPRHLNAKTYFLRTDDTHDS